MAQIDIGKLKPTWKLAYNNSTAYVVDDMVSYQSQSYICKLASTGNVPTNTTYWDLIAGKGTDGTDADLAAEAAIITKQMMLQKISISLVAQANLSESAKLNLVS